MKCDQCDKSFDSDQGLNMHKIRSRDHKEYKPQKRGKAKPKAKAAAPPPRDVTVVLEAAYPDGIPVAELDHAIALRRAARSL